MSGWIKLYRNITDHWIFTDSAYFKAWITILLAVNHENNSIIIEKELITCNRGQSLLSLDGWSKKFGKGWTIQRVRTFFEKLKNDNMIECEGLRKTTRLTICKYELYQNKQQTDNRQITDKQQADNKLITTNKNNKEGIKNEKNEKNIIPAPLNLVIQYCKTRNNNIDPQYFHDYNEARGWKINGKLMKDWQACIRTWERNNFNIKKSNPNDPDEFLKQLKEIEARNGN